MPATVRGGLRRDSWMTRDSWEQRCLRLVLTPRPLCSLRVLLLISRWNLGLPCNIFDLVVRCCCCWFIDSNPGRIAVVRFSLHSQHTPVLAPLSTHLVLQLQLWNLLLRIRFSMDVEESALAIFDNFILAFAQFPLSVNDILWKSSRWLHRMKNIGVYFRFKRCGDFILQSLLTACVPWW